MFTIKNLILILSLLLYTSHSFAQQYKREVETVFIKSPTLIILQLDSLKIENIKQTMGEENFYTASDDIMWYNSQLTEKMDSLDISIKYYKNDSLFIKTPSYKKLITKNSTSLYNYYYYNGEVLQQKELFELLNN